MLIHIIFLYFILILIHIQIFSTFQLINSKLFQLKQIHRLDLSHSNEIFPAIPLNNKSTKENLIDYQNRYKQSIEDPNTFWSNEEKQYIEWFQPYKQVSIGDLNDGDVSWFIDGKLNVCYNCIDKHIPTKANHTAMIWEGDEIGTQRIITFQELLKEVSRIANVLKRFGVKKGDVVTIYMPMIPELAMTMLACARIGAVHSVVFAGFSADSLKGRILDCDSKFIVTADEGKRGGKTTPLKSTVDAALNGLDIENCFVFKRTGANVNMKEDRDHFMDDWLKKERAYCPCEVMDSEDPLFILYTSGSTGKPKGVVHHSAGYLLYAAMTTKWSFNLQDNDVYCCAADCGWITGHSYIVYGPLCNGVTTTMFESLPTYPDNYRYWNMIEKYKITKFYTAPTAIRALMRYDTKPIDGYDLSSLKVLGSVGEPINPEAWRWYYNHVGRDQCSVVDTYWQTETGGHVGTNLPGAVDMKPGSCAFPFFGINFAILDPTTGKELTGDEVVGVLCIKNSWPGIARTLYGDHDRYLNVYLKPYPGYFFTGDGCRRDADGYYWITGRVDDVINPSGHRIGTAEIESALVACAAVSEAAVVGYPHDVKGEGIVCYVVLRDGFSGSNELTKTLKNAVRNAISPIATPDYIVYSDLPKTRSGKIMRRILRKIAAGEQDSIGDITTLADPSVVDTLIERYHESKITA
mmetsp:Transcript_8308/g.7440  ORF Transcript_8308/g.7440 Transcript_8308/m.7440 type:complete len:691 (+) Transcript_8308:19-2091(+)